MTKKIGQNGQDIRRTRGALRHLGIAPSRLAAMATAAYAFEVDHARTADAANPAGIDVVRELAEASEGEWQAIFERLRRARQLSSTVHNMNQLLKHPAHMDTAGQALQKIGLLHRG